MKSNTGFAATSSLLILLGITLWIMTPCIAQVPGVTVPLQGTMTPCIAQVPGVTVPLQVSKKDLCPVCGMFVHKYPNWLAQVVFSDGTCSSFDGPKDMFKYIFDLRKYSPKKVPGDISAFWVTDYYTTKWIDGKRAYYVIGSGVLGPMGHELVPHSSEKAAQSFAKDHGGERILKFDEVNLNLIESLR